MAKSGAVSEANARDLKKVHFVRAARTDKGVHAAGQIIACKLLMVPDMINEINKSLPEDIKVFGYRRVVAKFHAKNTCDARIYEYCIPTYLFERQAISQDKIEEIKAQWKLNPEPEVKSGPRAEDAFKKQLQQRKRKGRGGEEGGDENNSDGGEDGEEEEEQEVTMVDDSEEDLNRRKAFRISEERFAYLQQLMKMYEGTHNYHNFTTKKSHSDPSAKRFMMFFKVGCPCFFPFSFFFFFSPTSTPQLFLAA